MFFAFGDGSFGWIFLTVDILCAADGGHAGFGNIISKWAFFDFCVD